MRRALALAAVVPLAFASQAPGTLTPDGPATIFDDWHGAQTLEGPHADLLTAFRVTVQPGGRAGTVRFLLSHKGTVHASAPVTLPAEPGVYTFPAPHVIHDYRDVSVGIEQETGGHAIAGQVACEPQDGDGDICRSQSLDIYRPPLAPGARPDRGQAEVQPGRSLIIERVTEPDADGDLAGDGTEDRTNLRSSITHRKLAGGKREYAITIENAGPRVADHPQVTMSFYAFIGAGRFGPSCVNRPVFEDPGGTDRMNAQLCALAPIAVGEKRTVTFVIGDQGTTSAYASVKSEGPDLIGGDEFADVDVKLERPPLQLQIRPRPSLGGFSFDVHTRRAGPVTVRLRHRGRTYASRTVRFRRPGGKDLVMRVKRADRDKLQGRMLTLEARSRTTTTRVEIQPSY